MKAFATLIRLKKQQLDELRRKLVELETQKELLQRRSASLAEELQNEIKLAAAQVEMQGFFGNFAERIKQRRQEIAKQMGALDRQIDTLQRQIHTAFGELKKYEIVKERRAQEQNAEANRQENMLLDEVAIEQHLRKRPRKRRSRITQD